MKSLSCVIIVLLLAVALRAQGTLHPYLQSEIQQAKIDQKLPVYFVLADRLGYDHWFPRVNQLNIDVRRALVVAELKAHAVRTQRELLSALAPFEAAGVVEGMSRNWLGNFVKCRATPDAIHACAALKSVAEVWSDRSPLPAQVEDVGAPVADAPLSNAGFVLPNPGAGNGPTETRADLVWCLGIDGSGVVVMNSDSGINTGHNDLAGRLWTNPGEIPGNFIDDDGNGKIDDVYGWNFGLNNASLDDGGGHGTRTAGCLVADGTCNGTIYGQAPGARVMTGRLTGESSQWDAIQYALDEGAHTQTSSHSYKLNFNPPPNYRMHRDVGDNSLAAGLIRTNSTSNNGGQCGSATSFNRRPFNISAPGCLPPPYLDPNQTLVGQKGGCLGVGAHNVTNGNLMSYSPCGPFAWDFSDLIAVRPTYPAANWDPANHDDYPWNGGGSQGLLKPDLTSPTNTTTPSSGTCTTTTFSGTSNATPNANGCMILWKSANMSLKPEDVAMIAHQTATASGNLPGKEDGFGAGRIDARNGLDLALCVHRIDGEPAWAVDHSVAQPITLELDGVPNSAALIAIGTQRIATQTFGGVIGIGGTTLILWLASTDAQGDMTLNFALPASLQGTVVYTQAFLGDGQITNGLLSSNVIKTTFVP
ncbi:MAG: hypothetical protein CMJ83_11285 [Planctomycetes bacterium]|nr:hypothetical protein [Planctomycetota bacterium]